MTGDNGHRDGLSDLQRRGIATAMDVFDGLIWEVGNGRRPRMGGVHSDAAGDTQPELPDLRSAVARTIDLYAELFRRTMEVYADAVEGVLRADGAQPRDGAQVALTGAAGEDAVSTVWIHNTTAAPVHGLELHMTDLTSHDGARIAAAAASFAPARLDVELSSGRSSSLCVRIPPSAAPGTYVGHVLAAGLPGAGIAVCLVVAT
jgi:hypothetical protein